MYYVNVICFRMGVTLHDTHGHGHSHGGGAGHGHSHSDSHNHSANHRPNGAVIDMPEGNGEEQPLVPKPKRKTNINVRAAFIHVIGDFFQSLGVLVAALIIYFKVKYVLCRDTI